MSIKTLKEQIKYIESFPDCDLKQAVLGTLNIALTDNDANEHSLIWRLNQEQAKAFKDFTSNTNTSKKVTKPIKKVVNLSCMIKPLSI